MIRRAIEKIVMIVILKKKHKNNLKNIELHIQNNEKDKYSPRNQFLENNLSKNNNAIFILLIPLSSLINEMGISTKVETFCS